MANSPNSKTPLLCARRLVLPALFAATTSLSGCSLSLLSKADAPSAETAVAAADPAEPEAKPDAPATPKPAGLYVDPMISTASKTKSGRRELPLRTPPGGAMPAAPPVMARAPSAAHGPQATQAGQTAANNLGDVVNQPTGVHAYQNSIFALANANGQPSADGSVPAYAPARGINPMSGSVFSARTAPAAVPAPAGANNDGLW
ncbi:hypothetical protein [Affinirhizobium pseudoryzae]|uniref:hypothetical protein n=1 Tax=Allorhizobium pseudoryzae TaxID=379684 RepID=UPI0013EA29B8|nr:hypothetical protein [Allorhizobium pseudoryzae]